MATLKRTWAITGVAGFIGSNLLAHLLKEGHKVKGLDNLSTGHEANLQDVKTEVGADTWKNFEWIEGDIRNPSDCAKVCKDVEIVLHQAALGSVPRSITDPLSSHETNVTGFVNMLIAARDAKVKRVVYASSSSVYGDNRELPQREDRVGEPLSPYAVTKKTNEIYAKVFCKTYDMSVIGLRYFNVFGPRQDPNGPYAAVIPRWIDALIAGQEVKIFGDGSTSRDFCFIKNVVQMNCLAGTYERRDADGMAFNTAVSGTTSLNQLFELIRSELSLKLGAKQGKLLSQKPNYLPFRAGDILHSQADLSLSAKILGYQASHSVQDGMRETIAWYVNKS